MLHKLLAVAVLLLSTLCHAEVFLPSIFADHMVIQQKTPLKVFGRDNPGQRITVRLDGRAANTVAGADGRFLVDIDPPSAGGPFELVVEGSSMRTFTDVLVGEVWLCSGQSNMQWNVTNSDNAAEEIAAANYPQIRLFQIPMLKDKAPQDDIEKVRWRVCSPETVRFFSAVAYFFGRDLHRELDVPVGLIASAWGGTRAEAWTPRDALEQIPEMKRMLAVNDLPEDVAWQQHDRELTAWLKEMGLSNTIPGEAQRQWAEPAFDDSDWQAIKLPVMWQRAGVHMNGILWFRRTVEVPADADLSAPAELHLGTIDDFDIAFVNGQRVGNVGGETPAFWSVQRQYPVPAGTLRHGSNLIAVRVTDVGGNGGFGGPPASMQLKLGDAAFPLDGAWRYAVEQQIVLDPDRPRPAVPGTSMSATEVYNAMIHPLIPFPIAGVAWYQGESNVSSATAYHRLLSIMIDAWRTRWGDEFPFLIVQLAGVGKTSDDPNLNPPNAVFRAVQHQITRDVPNTALASAVDVGGEDAHPTNKQAVGKRLALQALRLAYGRDVVSSGPVIQSARREADRIVLRFDHAADGLAARDDTLERNFAIRSPAGEWSWADARIDGDTVILSAPDMTNATAVRYAWQTHPPASLYNSAALPALPFEVEVER